MPKEDHKNYIPLQMVDTFAKWDSSNPCFGCGNCCENVRLEISIETPIPEAFGDLAPYVVNPDKPIDHHDVPTEPGVYYAYGKRCFYLIIVGPCPQLDLDRSCKIHDKPRPKGCSTSGLESLKCIFTRKKS